MTTHRILIVAAALVAACQTESTGYIKLALPETRALRGAAEAPSATFEEASVSTWTVTVTGEDMLEPVVVTTEESEVTVKVPAGQGRLVHVSARAEAVDGIVQGYDGETTVDVPENGDAEAVVDVFRSVSVVDANQPVGRDGKTVSATAPDVESLTITLGAAAMQVYVEFANDVAAPWNASQDSSLRGLIEFDTDRNPLTGKVSLVQTRHRVLRTAAGETGEDLPLGPDFTLDLAPADEGFVKLKIGDVAKPVAAHFGARRLSVSVPYTEVGGKITAMRFAALLSDRSGAADFVPEKDYVEVAAVSTPAPEPKLAAITKFSGNFITTIDRTIGSAIPVLRSSPAGFKAAWTTGKGFDYATSENGEIFTVRKSVSLPAPQVALTLDLATDELGNATVVATERNFVQYCSVDCVLKASVLLESDGTIHEVVTTDNLASSSYSGKAKVTMVGGKAFVSDPLVDLQANSVYLFESGKRLAKAEVLPAGFYNVNNSLLIRKGVPVLTVLQQDFSVAPVTRVLEAVGQADQVVFTQPIKLFDAAQTSLSNLSVALLADDARYLIEDATVRTDLTVSDASGKATVLSGANFQGYAGTDPNYFYFKPYAAPEIAVSPSGRVGVVWHSSAYQIPAAPQISFAPGDNGHEIFYAELLPGETTFSAPVLVARGNTASLAFDALERPVIMVVNANLVPLDLYEETPQGSQYLYVYRGE